MHSNRRQRSLENSKKRERSRSVSSDRRRKRRQSRSSSGSRQNKRVRSRSRGGKRDRSGSRETSRRRSVSRDRKHKNRRRSSSSDSGTRDPTPRKHTKSAQPTPDSSATAEILSQFMNIVNNSKDKPASNDTKKVPDPNVLPEFDPNNKGHAMLTWLIRVDDVAKLFGWDEKETLQYSLPKLVGDAKIWYQTLTNVPFSWAEWKKTLLEQFPCPNFAELLTEMSNRHALPTETLEQYFYAKVVLLNRCGFKGRQAVDCLVQGIETDAIRLCAHAAQFAEPEELLVYLKSAESLRQIPKSITEPSPPSETKSTTKKAPTETKKTVCFHCGREGHKAVACDIREPFVKLNPGQMKKNLIRGPRPKEPGQFQPGHPSNATNNAFRGPRPMRPHQFQPGYTPNSAIRGPRPMGPGKFQLGHPRNVTKNAIRVPRPIGTLPEHEYIKPIFAKKCKNCKNFGHKPSECPEPQKLCNNCYKAGHTTEQCRHPKREGNGKKCFNCNEYGHISSRCPEKKKDGTTVAGASQNDPETQPAPPGLDD